MSPILDYPPATSADLDETGRQVGAYGRRRLAVTADQRDVRQVRAVAGRTLVTSSTQGRHGTKFGAAYSASKWGIIGLMKSAALELGAYGITVDAVIPGLVDTALTRHQDRYAQALAEAGRTPSGDVTRDEQAAVEALRGRTPLGVPWLAPEDVAPLVVFFASDDARMVSGATFAATAGDSAHFTS
ncbi:SDR family NAD(P)-dependent oxidoreductase [Micromonospora avicenniae]|uniref:SDR family NAD(P)-dependent oxidoreductase n=1 Tax=Micromonospora avicenniae TaxID=1198245 RepID=UPI001FE38992|nr:SDR family oxidoreductase [Micromonospora avicenniae]